MLGPACHLWAACWNRPGLIACIKTRYTWSGIANHANKSPLHQPGNGCEPVKQTSQARHKKGIYWGLGEFRCLVMRTSARWSTETGWLKWKYLSKESKASWRETLNIRRFAWEDDSDSEDSGCVVSRHGSRPSCLGPPVVDAVTAGSPGRWATRPLLQLRDLSPYAIGPGLSRPTGKHNVIIQDRQATIPFTLTPFDVLAELMLRARGN